MLEQRRTALCASAILSLAGIALADQLTVPSPEYPTIGAAIAAAVDGDEVLLLDGVYEGTGNWDATVFAQITIRGASGDASAVVIQGPDLSGFPVDAHRAFRVLDDVTIADLTLRGLSNSAVLVESAATATFRNVLFDGNIIPDNDSCETSFGAAAVVESATATFDQCVFIDNVAYSPTCSGTGRAFGGAIWAESARLTLRDCEFTANRVSGSELGRGGAIAATESDLRLERTTFARNAVTGDATSGGAINTERGTLEVLGCRFEDNRATGSVFGVLGGAINASRGGVATITNTTFAANTADGRFADASEVGGGAIASDGDLTLVNVLFEANEAAGPCVGSFGFAHGGALYVYGGGARAFHVTSVGNTSGCAAGVHVAGGATLFLGNSIVRDGAPVADPGGTIEATYSNIEGGLAGEGNIDAAPIYQPGSYRLASGSPGVDAGSVDNLIADELDMDGDGDTSEPTPLDLDGNARRSNDPATPDTGSGTAPLPDMGAYELVVCIADFDGDGQLTLFDFLAFQNAFDAGEPAADFDGDGELTLFDFLAFQNAFDAGC